MVLRRRHGPRQYRKVKNAAKSDASFDATQDTPPRTPMLVERHPECDIEELISDEWRFQETSTAAVTSFDTEFYEMGRKINAMCHLPVMEERMQ